MQNEWLDIGDFCIPLALKWRTLIHDWSPALLKFYLNAFQMTLPDQSNLVRWGKGTEKTCYICGKAVGTARHLLVGCKVLLDSGQYSRRHDRVLEIIREAVSLSVARAQKGITTNERSVGFVREGIRTIKTNVKPYSILKAATDWTIMMDTCEKQYKIPEDICASASRPDIFMYSRILKRVVMIELTVPWETNIPKDHTIKVNKYYELTNELTRNRFVVDLYAVEVGARGITAKSLYNLLKDLGLSRTHINSFLERTSKAALVGSFQIWLGRERSLDSGALSAMLSRVFEASKNLDDVALHHLIDALCKLSNEAMELAYSNREPSLFAVAKLLETGLANMHRIEVMWRPITNHLLEVVEPICGQVTTPRTWTGSTGEVPSSHRRLA
nr:uncharacterized protein LOC116768845 [Danaus plexippus plexippus]